MINPSICGLIIPLQGFSPRTNAQSSVVRPLHEESVDGLKGGSRRIDIVFRRNNPSKTLSDELLVDRPLLGCDEFSCQVLA